MGEHIRPGPQASEPDNSINRREALATLSGTTAGVASRRVDNVPVDKARKLVVYSPKDGYVVKVLVADRTTIKAGAVICRLDSEDETRAMERITVAQSLLDLEANLLSPDYISSHRRMLEIGLEVAMKYVEFAKLKYATERDNAALFVTLGPSAVQAEAALVKANAEKEKAEIALQKFAFNVEQAKARQALVRSQIPNEAAYIQKRIDKLSIVSPLDGLVKLLVMVDSFIEKGKPIAEIY